MRRYRFIRSECLLIIDGKHPLYVGLLVENFAVQLVVGRHPCATVVLQGTVPILDIFLLGNANKGKAVKSQSPCAFVEVFGIDVEAYGIFI